MYIRHLFLNGTIQHLVQHLDVRIGLDGDPGPHALRVDEADQFFRAGFLRRGGGWVGGCGGGDGGFVVEGIQVAACVFEGGDPFFGLFIVHK